MKLDPRKEKLQQLAGQIREAQAALAKITEKNTQRGITETPEEMAECNRLIFLLDGDPATRDDPDALMGLKRQHDLLDSIIRRAGGFSGQPDPLPHNWIPGNELSQRRSLGNLVVSDERQREWRGGFDNHPVRNLDPNSAWESPRVPVGTFFPDRRDFVTSTSLASTPLVMPDFRPDLDIGYRRPLTLLDLVTRSQTGSNLVKFMRETFTNRAKPTREARNASDALAAAPLSELAFVTENEPVKNISHHFITTVQALSDAAQLRGEIDNAGIYGIEEQLEDQMLDGDGVEENFNGILRHTDLSIQAWDTDIFTTTRLMKMKVATLGKSRPTAFVFSNLAKAKIDLAQDQQGRYYFIGMPWSGGPETIHGIPAVESQAPALASVIPTTTNYPMLCGDFRKAWLWDRQESSIFYANQHSDLAIKFLAAIIFLHRAAFGLRRPAAIVRGAIDPAFLA